MIIFMVFAPFMLLAPFVPHMPQTPASAIVAKFASFAQPVHVLPSLAAPFFLGRGQRRRAEKGERGKDPYFCRHKFVS